MVPVSVTLNNIFPSTKLYHVLFYHAVFIAWLNLDLGIETYFTDGLNPWLLGKHTYGCGFVSCLHLDHHCIHSCYFPIVGNSVQVLGMVLLLSYTKILCPLHHISALLWWSIPRIVICLYGGNTQYTFHLRTSLSSENNCHCNCMPPIHSGAFVIQCIHMKAHHRGLHNFFAKMKPILDVNFGPFKTNTVTGLV